MGDSPLFAGSNFEGLSTYGYATHILHIDYQMVQWCDVVLHRMFLKLPIVWVDVECVLLNVAILGEWGGMGGMVIAERNNI